jgi:hypothetical protein
MRWMARIRNRAETVNNNIELYSMPKTMTNAENEIAAIICRK